MFRSSTMKRAWTIRKLAAIEYRCRCGIISWKECMLIALEEETTLLLTVEKKMTKMTTTTERKPVMGDRIELDCDAAYVARITRESGLKLMPYGSTKTTYLTARWAGGGKFYYLSEGSLGSGGKIFLSVEKKGYEDVTFWILGREAALQKICSLVADGCEMEATPKVWVAVGRNTYHVKDQLKAGGMKWRNERWESSVKPTLSIPGVEFIEK